MQVLTRVTISVFLLTSLSALGKGGEVPAIAGNVRLPGDVIEAIRACEGREKTGSFGDVRDCLRLLSASWEAKFLESVNKLNKAVTSFEKVHGKNKTLPAEIISAKGFGKITKTEASRVILKMCEAEAVNLYRHGSGHPAAYSKCFISLTYLYGELVKQMISMVESTSHD